MRVLRRVLRSLSLALAATLLGGVLGGFLGGFLGGGAINGGIGPARAGLMEGLEAHGRDAFGRAAAFLRPHARPIDRGGIPAARHALAQIALIQGEDSPRALAEADALLDPVTRCAHPDFLGTYGYVLERQSKIGMNDRNAIAVYKESANAGSSEAMYNLGLYLVQEMGNVFLGISYLIDAANQGLVQAQKAVNLLEADPKGRQALARARDIADTLSVRERRPDINNATTMCATWD